MWLCDMVTNRRIGTLKEEIRGAKESETTEVLGEGGKKHSGERGNLYSYFGSSVGRK